MRGQAENHWFSMKITQWAQSHCAVVWAQAAGACSLAATISISSSSSSLLTAARSNTM